VIRRPLFLLLLVVAACGTFQIPAEAAQSGATDASLRGTIVDATGAPVAGAFVTVVSDRDHATATTTSDLRGDFSISIPAGPYALGIAAPGFVDVSEHLAASASRPQSRRFVLQIAGVREDVTVSAPVARREPVITTATKTPTPLRDVPQSITVVDKELMNEQLMTSIGDVVRYVPGITLHQGENNRDQVIIRGNSSSADFFLNGVRDDVQYYRDVYNLDRVEALKGPNAMIFGRGGAGGVINRVSKQAGFEPIHELSVQAGMYGDRRVTGDLDQPLGQAVAFRLNGMVEHSDSFRNFVGLDRYGVTPTVMLTPKANTIVTFRYEYLHDARVADRGIPSRNGRPVDVDIATYYGDPDASRVGADVNLATATIEHRAGRMTIRNHTSFGDYDRSYQNFVPGAVTADARLVSLTAYNNATARRNLFNQTDLTYALETGRVRHTLLAGAELGSQLTNNFRNTGFFNNTAASILVPLASPTISTPVVFRQNATDADNRVRATVAAVYAQDQIELSRYLNVVAGLRFDRFDLEYHNNRNGDTLTRPDDLVSPRVGVVVKPVAPLSLYSSYGVSYLPGSGDQFASLTVVSKQLEPEKFENYEVGAKWDALADLAVTAAVYRLDRTNTRATDPNDPTRIVQTGSQRTSGFELGVNGRVAPVWSVAGGYAYQHAFVTSATAAAAAGAQVGQVPRHTLSLWNNYRIRPRLSAGLGLVYRSDMFATIDDTVTLPGYVRADAAGFFTLTDRLRVQMNVENVFDRTYYANADSNTNISPGYPRTLRVALTVR